MRGGSYDAVLWTENGELTFVLCSEVEAQKSSEHLVDCPEATRLQRSRKRAHQLLFRPCWQVQRVQTQFFDRVARPPAAGKGLQAALRLQSDSHDLFVHEVSICFLEASCGYGCLLSWLMSFPVICRSASLRLIILRFSGRPSAGLSLASYRACMPDVTRLVTKEE